MSTPPSGPMLGTWGGEQVMLTIGPDTALLRLGCAEGEFPAPDRLDETGRFVQAGSFNAHGGGPSTADERTSKAQFEGVLTGDQLSLTVRHGSSVETHRLTRGLQSKVIRCL